MKKFFKQALIILLLLFVTITIVFFLMHAIGDGPSIINSSQIDESVKNSFIQKYGMDKPLYVQLLIFWKNLLSGDFGVSLSIHLGKEINEFIWPKFGYSLLIGGLAAIFGYIIGISIGIAIGLRMHKGFDKFMQILISFFIALPAFIIALVLVIAASSTGFPIIFEQANPITWILPIISIAVPSSMSIAKRLRTGLVASLDTQYAKLAKSKGVVPRNVIFRHLLKESLYTIATNLPATILLSVVSSILVENIFSIPGLGRLYTQAIQSKDYNVVLAVTSIMVVLVSISFIIRDFLYRVLNPVMRRKGGK